MVTYKGGVKTTVKDYDDALRCYNEALEINPKFAEAYNAKAGVLFRKKEKQKAIDEVKKAIEIDPALASAHENLTKLIVSTENQRHEFMHFWINPRKRLVVPVMLGLLAYQFDNLFSIYRLRSYEHHR